MLDTNAVASTDTNLFNALSSFSDDNGTNPVLQVMPYNGNCLLFKASHFDYSGESTRDFCLAVCDKVETPLYKNINLSKKKTRVISQAVTYSIRWAVQSVINQYPEMDSDPKTGRTGTAMPTLFGSPKLIDTTVYDDELTRLNFSHVKEN